MQTTVALHTGTAGAAPGGGGSGSARNISGIFKIPGGAGGAGSVVLNDVPPHKTVAGVPAIVVGVTSGEMPAIEMNQTLDGGFQI